MTLSIEKINSLKGSTKQKIQMPIQDGSGLYLDVEQLPRNCKRFFGKTYFIKGGNGKNRLKDIFYKRTFPPILFKNEYI